MTDNKPPTLREQALLILRDASTNEYAVDAILTAFDSALPEKKGINLKQPMQSSFSNGKKVGYDKAIEDMKAILHKEKKG